MGKVCLVGSQTEKGKRKKNDPSLRPPGRGKISTVLLASRLIRWEKEKEQSRVLQGKGETVTPWEKREVPGFDP